MYNKEEVTRIVKEGAKKILTKKIMVGEHSVGNHSNDGHKVGDVWTDLDGVKWEQKEHYRVKLSNTPKKGIADNCKDCGNFVTKSYDKDTYARFQRCYGCQTTFELDLKFMRIGKNGNKWQFWVRLQELLRYSSAEKDYRDYLIENKQHLDKGFYDKDLQNALANNELSITKEKIQNGTQ